MAVYRIEAPEAITGNVCGVLVANGVGYIPYSGGGIGHFTRAGWTVTELAANDPRQPTLAVHVDEPVDAQPVGVSDDAGTDGRP